MTAEVHPIVDKFASGSVPDPLKGAAARGALPLPPSDLLLVLFHLRAEEDLQDDVRRTLAEMEVDHLKGVADDPESSHELLDFLARSSADREPVLEALLLNAELPDATVVGLSTGLSPSLLELLALNQVRLVRSPQIIQGMLQNPRVTLSVRRRLKEVWELHQATQPPPSPSTAAARPAAPAPAQAEPSAEAAAAPAAPTAETAAPAEPAAAPAEAPAEPAAAEAAAASPAAAATPTELSEDDLAELDDLDQLGESTLDAKIIEELQEEDAPEEELRLAQRLLMMSVAEKVQLALKGDRGDRGLLIRDASKMVQEAVVKSPKITEDEVEKIANMRSISADVLRMIGGNREYTRNYSTVLGLVKNPRTPVPVALQLMPRLQTRDLKFMLKDKNIAEGIRRQCRITIQKRDQKK
ncbi:MAG: hypothetical protein AAF533_16035 [Acidobacteriota bacterium]